MSDPKEKKTIILPENVPTDYTFERMLKNFMKQVQKEGILDEVKKRRYYIKPSAIKRMNKKSKRRIR